MTSRLRVLVVAALAWAAAGDLQPARAAGLSRLTLIVAPARYSVLQLMFDVERRFPVVLLSYEGDASTEVPRLNAWNGNQWAPVTLEDYREGGFLQARPERAVLIGDEKLLPPAMAAVETWCPKVTRVPTLDTATIVNSFGKLFHFSAADWKWFAARYHLDLRDVNEKRRTESWYDRPAWTDKPRPTPAPPTLKEEPIKPAEIVPAPAAAPTPAPAAETPAEPAAPAAAGTTNAPAGPLVK